MGRAVGTAQQQPCQRQAHQGAGGGHQQRTHGRGAFPLHAGHTPQHEQGDAAHLHPLADGGDGVAQLVQQHRHEQQQGRAEAQDPQQGPAGLAGELLAVLLLKGKAGQGQDHKPAGVDAQRDSTDLQQLPAFAHAHHPSGPILERTPRPHRSWPFLPRPGPLAPSPG